MFSFIKNIIAEYRRTKELERELDELLIDHNFLSRVEIANAQARIKQAEARIIAQAEPVMHRLREIRKEYLFGSRP